MEPLAISCKPTTRLRSPKRRTARKCYSVATMRLEKGAPNCQDNSQVSFTMQTYAHVLPEVQRSVATKSVFGEAKLDCKLFILWCAQHDSNMRPSGS